jgi:hypothetical protein
MINYDAMHVAAVTGAPGIHWFRPVPLRVKGRVRLYVQGWAQRL